MAYRQVNPLLIIFQSMVLTFIVLFCVTAYLKYDQISTVPMTVIADRINQNQAQDKTGELKADYRKTSERPLDRPYLIPSDEILKNLNETELLNIYWSDFRVFLNGLSGCLERMNGALSERFRMVLIEMNVKFKTFTTAYHIEKQYLMYINTLQILCRNQSRFGSWWDGGKEVCLDEAFKPKKPCIVYSFGSNFQFDFDMEIYHSFGCAVYTFDPSMDIKKKSNKKKIPKELTFIEAGLSGTDHVTSEKWQMKTLKTLLGENGHQEKTIDILKMDIEGGEWHSIPNMLESGAYKQVKQLLVEFHFGRFLSKPENKYWGDIDMAKQIRGMRMLYDYGFRVFMRERTLGNFWKMQEPPYREITTQNEICYINTAFLKP